MAYLHAIYVGGQKSRLGTGMIGGRVAGYLDDRGGVFAGGGMSGDNGYLGGRFAGYVAGDGKVFRGGDNRRGGQYVGQIDDRGLLFNQDSSFIGYVDSQTETGAWPIFKGGTRQATLAFGGELVGYVQHGTRREAGAAALLIILL
jgi:hypothetical protein